MLDHIGIKVRDFERSSEFYEHALEPLGWSCLLGWATSAGFGDAKPFFWITSGEPTSPMHIAFAAKDRASVDAFHAAALAAGGRDNGAPGLRPDYHPNYYAAFVLDPYGHNIEAVCHNPA
ncbi:VOC family protein [Phenylobacterium deserti]|uniref:VOC family protein n=1 Tax=Phenylobacterium deserti TaxID=1914756 RepID=A0A328AXP0_9CAUL|nr:VOC family protein [Phenylobacterium deserti]RAK57608.1 VOC family protein [Phenylobacterium deserti]